MRVNMNTKMTFIPPTCSMYFLTFSIAKYITARLANNIHFQAPCNRHYASASKIRFGKAREDKITV